MCCIFLFILHLIFFICSDPEIGDKYSVFRQLEQPADKKPVGKKPFFPHILIKNTLTYILAKSFYLFFFLVDLKSKFS